MTHGFQGSPIQCDHANSVRPAIYSLYILATLAAMTTTSMDFYPLASVGKARLVANVTQGFRPGS